LKQLVIKWDHGSDPAIVPLQSGKGLEGCSTRREVNHQAMINSMTPEERKNYHLLTAAAEAGYPQGTGQM
jgi:signal recognition particle GTPase